MYARTTKIFRTLLLALVVGAVPGCSVFMPDSKLAPEIQETQRRYRELLDEQRAKALNPGPDRKVRSYDELLVEGDKHRNARHPDQAIWLYMQAFRKEPDRPEAKVRIAYLHLAEEPERSAAILAKVAEEHPESASSLLGLGLAGLATGKLETTIDAARQLIALDPDSPIALAALGVALDVDGRHDEAQQYLQRAAKLAPFDSSIRNDLGISYMRSGDFEASEATLRAALVQSPDLPSLHNALAFTLAKLGRYAEALDHFERAGDSQSAHNNLGYAYYLNGDHGRAAEHYEKALLAGGDHTVTVLRNMEEMRTRSPRTLVEGE